MAIYLQDIPLPEAIKRLETALKSIGLWKVLGGEEIPLNEYALGRVLCEPVWAKISSPHYHASAMDGFALRSEDSEGATQTVPKSLMIGTQAVYVDTGDPLPDWANAVIMIENTEPIDKEGQITEIPRRPNAIRIRASVPPWHHVRPMGEDMVATQLVLPSGHSLRPVDLGAIAGSGHAAVKVSRRPKVAIIPTGSELKNIGESVEPGDIIEYNSMILAAQIRSWGGEPIRYPIVHDVLMEIKAAVVNAAQEADLVLLNAGSSAGSEDFSAQVVQSLGELLVHGVAVRPGHPVILGLINKVNPELKEIDESKKNKGHLDDPDPEIQIPIIGVPGYPVSAALTGEIFVEPLIAKWLGRQPSENSEVIATLTRKITSPAGDHDYMRMAVGVVGNRTLAAPLPKGSGVISSLVRADGIMVVPNGIQGYPAGEQVNIRLYRSPSEIERTIFATGSHDMSLDVLAQFLSAYHRRLISSNVGSLGGLVSLKRDEAHLAGSHLLDPESGIYNLPYISTYLPGKAVKVIALVSREQGLIVQKMNPKSIQSLVGLVREDVQYVNRQRGAGTRVLLDYHLSKAGLSSENIRGYTHEEYTHLAVAAAVASGRADCGLGISAAAKALDLDFIPLYQERYDLVIPKIFADCNLLAPLFQVLEDENFQKEISDSLGYDTSSMGYIIAEFE